MMVAVPSKGKESSERESGASSGPGLLPPGESLIRPVLAGYAILLITMFIGLVAAGLFGKASTAVWPRMLALLLAIWYVVRRAGFLPRLRTEVTVPVALAATFVVAVYWLVVALPLGVEHSVRTGQILQAPLMYQMYFVILGPLLEETLFRGFLLEAFRRKWNGTAALFASSILFVLAHALFWFKPSLIALTIASLHGLVISLTLGVSYMYGGLVAAVIIHCLYNSLFLMTYVPGVP